MKDSKIESNPSPDDNIINLNIFLFIVFKLVVILFALFLCLRFPALWIKVPAAIAVLWFGFRWLFKPHPQPKRQPDVTRKSRPSPNRQSSAIERYKAQPNPPSSPEHESIRRLIAYDAAGEFGKAKALIQSFDGEVFPESVAYELAVLAGNYFPVELEPADDGLRFKLVAAT